MATPGTITSGVGHAGLVIWLVAGWGFNAEPLPFEVSEVSVVSGEEYERIVAASTPQPGTADPSVPPVPEVDEAAPAPDVPAETAPTQTQPEVVEPPAPETPPATPEQPAEPATVTDAIPDLPPAPETPAPGAPDLAVSPRPQERQADRIAPTQVAPPPEDVPVAEVETASAAPEQETPAEVVEEQVEEAAPEEAATAIVPEDTAPSGAVEASVRPAVRPNRPTPAPTPAPVTPAETSTASSDNVNTNAVDDAAVAAAVAAAAAATQPDVPQGPPMSGSEREGFRVAVNRCWNVDPGSVAARVTMVVGFSLDQNGKVQGDVRQVSASGGDGSAQSTAFEAARRAILRCQNPNGYQLPADKYGQWKDVEITFDPSGMRLR